MTQTATCVCHRKAQNRNQRSQRLAHLSGLTQTNVSHLCVCVREREIWDELSLSLSCVSPWIWEACWSAPLFFVCVCDTRLLSWQVTGTHTPGRVYVPRWERRSVAAGATFPTQDGAGAGVKEGGREGGRERGGG